MRVVYEAVEDTGGGGPFVGEADVVGLYRPDVAVVAGRATACDPGSGPVRIDD